MPKNILTPRRKHVANLVVIFIVSFALAAATAVFLFGYAEGPPAGENGGLNGSSTCAICHSSFPVNDPSSNSQITLSGFPSTYVPGQQYMLAITVGIVNPANPTGRKRFGFQLSARSTSSPFPSAGTLALIDTTTGFDVVGGFSTSNTPVNVNGVFYVSHNASGTCFGSTSCTWNVNWTAPNPAAGPVEFDIAGNAANGDFTNQGDYILTQSVIATPAAPPSPAPMFANLNPISAHIGSIRGGTPVTLNGSNFVNGALVFFGSNQASTAFISSSQLTAISPPATAAGAVDIKVQNPGGLSATLTGAFTYFDDTQLKIADAVATNGASSVSPAGSGIFSFSQNNILVTTVGTPSANPTTKLLLFVDSKPFACAIAGCALQNNTGLAIINRSGSQAHLTYILHNPDGTQALAPVNKTLDDGGHDQGFITDFFGAGANNFTGTLEVDSDVPVSALTLQLNSNQAPRNETLFTSFPVADLTQAPPGGNLVFAQLVDGGGYQTRILLLNTTTNPITGKVFFFTDSGSPASFGFGAGPVSQLSYNIQPKGEFDALSTGLGPLNVGFALVVPDSGQASPVGTGVFAQTANGFTFTTAGVPSSAAIQSGLILSDTNPTSGGLAQDTGVALANPSATQTADVTFTLRRLADGSPVASKNLSQIPGQSMLPPHGHAALFVDQIFTNNEARNFTGTLSIDSTSSEGVSALTLLQTSNQRGDPLLTTLPVATDTAATSPVFFPQLVDFAGFQTQLILLDPSATTGSSGILNFFDGSAGATNGSPLALPLNDQVSSSFPYNIPSKGGATFK